MQPPSQIAEQPVASAPDLRKFSCLPCRQRKVKCDRQDPCSHCIKTSRQCSFIDPVRGKRKRKSVPKEGLHAKLRRYEELLKSHGADIEPSENANNDLSDAESEPDVQMIAGDHELTKMNVGSPFTFGETKSKLISSNGSSRYFDNGLWPNLGDEFHQQVDESRSESLNTSTAQQTSHLDDASHMGSLVLGKTPKNEDLANLHFPLHTVQALLDVYRDRVDPLMKFLHLPTLWSAINDALKHPHEISKSLAALMFSIYFTTITSLEENECLSLLREPKSILTERYKNAAHLGLTNADFLNSSSMMTLQAYATYLVGMRGQTESTSICILSGIAVRLARRMGLHRDGTLLGLSLFETEMRRRLWWQIAQVDWSTSNHSGTQPSLDLFTSDTKRPLNVEDEDIYPNMSSPPSERTGITPLVLLLLRHDLMDFLRRFTPQISIDIESPLPGWSNLTSPNIPISDKENLINEMEDMLERRYLRYFDPSNALHYFASILARSSVCKMKLLAHNPRQYSNSGAKVPQRSRDILFANATKMLEYASLSLSNESAKKFTWQVSSGYLWDTLHCVLIEVRDRKIGPQVDRAWQLIGGVFVNYPQIFEETADSLYAALGNWTLRVWDEVALARKTEGLPELATPEFILALRRCRRPRAKTTSKPSIPANVAQASENAAAYGEVQPFGYDGNTAMNLDSDDSYDFANLLSYELDQDEWMQWERLLSGQAL